MTRLLDAIWCLLGLVVMCAAGILRYVVVDYLSAPWSLRSGEPELGVSLEADLMRLNPCLLDERRAAVLYPRIARQAIKAVSAKRASSYRDCETVLKSVFESEGCSWSPLVMRRAARTLRAWDRRVHSHRRKHWTDRDGSHGQGTA